MAGLPNGRAVANTIAQLLGLGDTAATTEQTAAAIAESSPREPTAGRWSS